MERRIIEHIDGSGLSKEEHKVLLLKRERAWELALRAAGVPLVNEMTCGVGGILCAESKKKLSASLKLTFSTPEQKLKKSQTAKEVMSRPEVIAAIHSPSVIAKRKITLKATMTKPEIRQKIRDATREAMSRPEIKERHRLSVTNEETRRLMSKGSKERELRKNPNLLYAKENVISLRKNGCTITKIAHTVGVCPTTVKNILRRERKNE